MALSFQSNLVELASRFLHLQNIPVTKTTLKKQLEENPYYPSLYSLSKVFTQLGVDNEAFEVTEDKFDDFEPPYFAYYNNADNGKHFVLVTDVTAEGLTYTSDGKRPITTDKQEFFKGFQKVIFAAEKHPESGEKDYEITRNKEKALQNKKQLRYAGLALLVVLAFGQFFYTLSAFSWPAVIISIAKLAGLAVTILLLVYETDKSNSLVKNICTSGRQFNCDAVINSKASRIFGLSWGEVGFFYFSSTCLFLLSPGFSFAEKIPWLAAASTIAAPYIVFSVYYQWRVVKQWCPLCLMVQAALLVECVWSIAYFWTANIYFPAPGTIVLTAAAVSILTPVVAWQALRPLIDKSRTGGIYQQAYKRLLHHPETIKSILLQQESAPEGWEQLGIDIGNSAAPNTILKVCNPYCGPCAQAHAILEQIVHYNKDVRIKIIFTASNSEHDRSAPVVRHLLAIHGKGYAAETENALDDWYLAEKKEYDRFSAKYPLNGELKHQDEKIDQMNDWCKKAGIYYTPTIFVNGKRLPADYDAGILKNIF